jgi:hypothetical protein
MATLVIGAAGASLPVNTDNPFNGTAVSGNGNLYVSRSPGVNAANAEKTIGGNGTFTYPPGINSYSLYFATDPGNTVTLSYSTDGSSLTSGTTFARNVNVPTLIESIPLPIPAGAGTFAQANIPTLDISAYSSVIFIITSTCIPNQLDPQNFIELNIQEYNDPTAQRLGLGVSYDAQWLIDFTGAQLGPQAYLANMYLQVPVKQQTLTGQLTVRVGNALPGPGTALQLYVYGSGEQINTPVYRNNTANCKGTINIGGVFTAADTGISNNTRFIGTQGGPALITVMNLTATATGVGELGIYESGTKMTLAFVNLTATPLANNLALSLPMRPVYIRSQQNAATPAAMEVALTQ